MNLIDANVNELPRRVLVVDDNEQTLQVVRMTLERGGFEVLTASGGQEALTLIQRNGLPHLALVDLNMPMMNGFEFCQALHEFSDVPVVMLTAVDEEHTIVKGIDLYAEDYIVKPFRPSELVARINRVLRRIGDFAYLLDPVVKIDDSLSVDFSNRTAFVKEEEVSLTPTETKILYILMRNAGQTVTTDFLLRRVWPLESAYEDRLHVHVHRLRRKVETDPSSPHYIVSKRGAGYVFPKLNSRT